MTQVEPRFPELVAGDRLTRAEFHRRYEAMPQLKKAELIEGVVYVGGKVRWSHAHSHAVIVGWLGKYHAATPGTDAGCSSTVRLDHDNEPQPDALLFIEEACGGQARVDEEDFVAGAPELIAE